MQYAVFDWDNTLCSGYALFSLARHLEQVGYIGSDVLGSVTAFDDAYASGEIDHDGYARLACGAFSKAIAGLSAPELFSRARRYSLGEYKGMMYGYALPVLRLLEERGVRAIIVSGAPEMMLVPISEAVGPFEVLGYAPELSEDGLVFTGATARNCGAGKDAIMDSLRAAYGAPLLGFGDSSSDLPLLRASRNAFVVGRADFEDLPCRRIDPADDAAHAVRIVRDALEDTIA